MKLNNEGWNWKKLTYNRKKNKIDQNQKNKEHIV
jgi:hypothetical protein